MARFPLDREDLPTTAGVTQLGVTPAATEDLKSWIDWTVGDPHAFWKAFVTGYRDPNTWAQSGAFFVGEVEGFVEGVTFGLWKPNFGADALAHLTGLPPGGAHCRQCYRQYPEHSRRQRHPGRGHQDGW